MPLTNEYTIEKAKKTDATQASKLMYLAFDDLSHILFGTKDLNKIESYFAKLWIQDDDRLSSRYSHVIRENGKAIGLISCSEGDLTTKLIWPSFIEFLKVDPGIIFFALKHLNYLYSIFTVREAFEDEYYIFVLAVMPEYQGKGIGGKLIQFAEETAKRKGFKKVSLLVNANNLNAIEFYENHGFKKVELISKAPLNNYRMVKELLV